MPDNSTLIIPPDLQDYIFRPIRREDAEAIHQLLVATEAVDNRGLSDTLDDRNRDMDDPMTNIDTHSLLAWTPNGEVAGMGWIFIPPPHGQELHAFAWGEVHPLHRQRGLGGFLLSWMEARAEQLLERASSDLESELPRDLRQNIPANLSDRVALLEEHGYKVIRASYRMSRDLSEPIPPVEAPAGVRLEHWDPALDQEVMDAFNESFRDHWGFFPASDQAWKLWFTGHPSFRPELTFLALDESSPDGNPVVGFSLNQVREVDSQGVIRRVGWIHELGVRRPWRKRGIATALLCTSMRAFQESGLKYAGLGVDSQNPTGALRIYERLGFQVIHHFVTYAKRIE